MTGFKMPSLNLLKGAEKYHNKPWTGWKDSEPRNKPGSEYGGGDFQFLSRPKGRTERVPGTPSSG